MDNGYVNNINLGEPSKLKSAETWEKFPTGVGGGHRKLKKFPSFSWEKFKKRGGAITFQKGPKLPKVPEFERKMHYFISHNTLKQKDLYFVVLKMANKAPLTHFTSFISKCSQVNKTIVQGFIVNFFKCRLTFY